MAFRIGEKVVYPNHGIGVIEEISTKDINGAMSRFYMLRLNATNSVVMVPLDNIGEVGLRPPITSNDCEQLLKLLSDNFTDPPTDWKGRYKDFLDKMRSGDLFSVAEVLKHLTYLNNLKPLSFREKRMLERSRHLVISELIIAWRKPEAVVSNLMDEALKRACTKHERKAARAAAAATR